MRTPDTDRTLFFVLLIGLDGYCQTGAFYGPPPDLLDHPAEVGYNGRPHRYELVGYTKDHFWGLKYKEVPLGQNVPREGQAG